MLRRALGQAMFMFRRELSSKIPLNIMPKTATTSTRMMCTLGTKTNQNKLVEAFQHANSRATLKDLNRFKKYLQLVKKTSLSDYAELDDFHASHDINSLSNKIILLEMLKNPVEEIDYGTIQSTIAELNFDIQQDFLNEIHSLLRHGGIHCNSAAEVDFLTRLASKIEKIETPAALRELYLIIKISSRIEIFRRGYLPYETVLDFFILGELNQEIHDSLFYRCTSVSDFTCHPRYDAQKDNEAFEKIKPVIVAVVRSLVEDNLWENTLPISPYLDLANLLSSVILAENEVDVVSALYPVTAEKQHILIFKSWHVMRREILENESFFSDPSNIPTQLHLMLFNAKSLGIKLEENDVDVRLTR